MSFDLLQSVFWSITYIIIIVVGVKTKKILMPTIAILLNFAWELIALQYESIDEISAETIVLLIWFCLDFVIMLLLLIKYGGRKVAVLLVVFVIFCGVLYWLFRLDEGKLLSCFAIDLIMAISFVISICKIKRYFWAYLAVGVSKLIGDLFAWIAYSYNATVYVIGIVVLCLNIIYLVVYAYQLIVHYQKRTPRHHNI